MKRIIKRISSLYYKLKETRLINKCEIDEDSVSHFQKLLNDSYPKNDLEHHVYYLIKSLYYSNKNKFKSYIKNTAFEYLILYTDNIGIVNHFNLKDNIFISWDKANKKFIINAINNIN